MRNWAQNWSLGEFLSVVKERFMGSTMTFGWLALTSVLLVACGGQGSTPTATESAGQVLALDEGSGQLALEKKFANYQDDVVLDAEGNIQKSSKRSNFEGKQLTSIGGGLGKKQFAASRYSKENWQGTKNFDAGRYKSSRNRWDQEEWFMQKQAREAQTSARGQGQTFSTGDYRTAAAQEQRGNRLARPSNAQADFRKRVGQKPLIIDNEDYEKLTLEESKNILGR